MFKSTIVRHFATAAIAASLAFGATHVANSQHESYDKLQYLVFQKMTIDGQENCNTETVLGDAILNATSEYIEQQPMAFCVATVATGERDLPLEELGDLGLIGVYDATDDAGEVVPFTVYMPMVSRTVGQQTPQPTEPVYHVTITANCPQEDTTDLGTCDVTDVTPIK